MHLPPELQRRLSRGEPALKPERPPAGVARFRAGMWCGVEGHPRQVIEADCLRTLDQAELRYRCPQCRRSAAWAQTR